MRIFKNQAGQNKYTAISKKKRVTSRHEMLLSRMKSEHTARVTEIENLNNQEVAQFQQDFEKALEDVEQWGEACVNKEVSAIQNRIHSTTKAMEKAQQSFSLSRTEDENFELSSAKKTLSFEADRIERLEETLKQKSQSRLDLLNSLKDRLSESVSTLEELERDHSTKMSTLSMNIQSADRRHAAKVSTMTEKHNKEMRPLQRQQRQLEAKSKSLEKTIASMTEKAEEELQVLALSASELRNEAELARESSKIIMEEAPPADLQGDRKRLLEAQTRLADKENALCQARVDNENLKREIARLRHEKMIQTRRALFRK